MNNNVNNNDEVVQNMHSQTPPIANTPSITPTDTVSTSPQIAQPINLEEVEPSADVTIAGSPTVQETVVQPSVIEDNNNSSENDVTIDYNQLYGVQSKNTENIKTEEEKPVFTTQDITIDNHSLNNRNATDVTPEFNIGALDSSIEPMDTKLTDKVLNEKQQDRADTRKKILFIGILVLLIIVFVEFIFPILAGYNL